MIGSISLDDDVARTADDSQTLALDDTGRTRADQGFVGFDGYAEDTGVVAERASQFGEIDWNDGVWRLCVLADRDGGRVGLIVRAPVVLVDGKLASRCSTPGRAAGASSSSLCAGEVEGLRQNDHAR